MEDLLLFNNNVEVSLMYYHQYKYQVLYIYL